MTTLRALRAPVKPTRRAPLPLTPFGDGILEADLAAAFTVGGEPAEHDWMAELDPDWSIRPDVYGSGLEPEEWAKVTRAGFRVRDEYRAASPDASADEFDRVELKGRQDALRAVLKRRPPASVSEIVTDGVTEMITPSVGMIATPDQPTMDEMSTDGHHPIVNPNRVRVNNGDPCCDADELAPCLACDADHPTDASRMVANLPRLQRWTPRPAPEAEPLLSLAELVEAEADRLRARGNAAGDLMARSLSELARVIRTVDAMTPGDVDARLEILERDFMEPVEYDREPELTAAGHWA